MTRLNIDINVVTPNFEDLVHGSWFTNGDNIFIKTDDHFAVRVDNGEMTDFYGSCSIMEIKEVNIVCK